MSCKEDKHSVIVLKCNIYIYSVAIHSRVYNVSVHTRDELLDGRT